MHNELWDTSTYILKERAKTGWSPENEEHFYLSSVVVAELATGYSVRKEELVHFENYVSSMKKKNKLITPNEYDWFLTGLIIGEIISRRPDLKNKKALLFNDCLIATSSKIVDAKVVTANKSDFELIRKWLNFEVSYITC